MFLQTLSSFHQTKLNDDAIEIFYDFNNGNPLTSVKVFDDSLLKKRAELTITSRFYSIHESLFGGPKELKSKKLFHSHLLLDRHQTINTPFQQIYPFDYNSVLYFIQTEFKLVVYQNGERKTYTSHPISTKKLAETKHNLLNPKDKYSFIKNLKKIVPVDQKAAILWIGLAIMTTAIILTVGIHDEFCYPSDTWVFSQPDSHNHVHRRREATPLTIAISIASMMFLSFYALMKASLRKYVTKVKTKAPTLVKKDTHILLRELIDGHIVSNLNKLQIRVVGGNYEKSVTGTGRDRKTVNRNCNEVVLFDKTFIDLKAGKKLSDFFNENDFVPMAKLFESCFPSILYSSNYGISLHWEVQFIHDELVDHEYIGPNNIFEITDFEILKRQSFVKDILN